MIKILLPLVSVLLTAVTLAERSNRLLTNDDDFVYSNPADTYKPNEYVKWGHEMSRNDKFDRSDYMTYLKNAAYMPGALVGLGILSFLFINLFLFFRCCCKCIACPPNEKEERDVLLRKRFRVLTSFYIIIFLAVAFNTLLYLANNQFGKAVTTFQGTVDDVQNIVDSLILDVDDLVGYANKMDDTLGLLSTDISHCKYLNESSDLGSFFSDASSAVSSFSSTAGDLHSQTDGVDNSINDFQDRVNLYANTYRLRAIAALWLLPILVILLLSCTHCCRSKLAMQCSIFLVWLVFLLLIILGAFWAFVVTSSSTICMDPIETLNRQAPSSMRKYTMYYTACQGQSFIEKNINSTVDEINKIQDSLTNMTNYATQQNISTYCPNNNFLSDINTLQGQLSNVTADVLDVEYLTGCHSFQPIFFSLVNEAFCTEFYTGFFYLWGSQLWTNFMLFIMILVASYVWQYYASWKQSALETEEYESDDGAAGGNGGPGHGQHEEEDDDDHFFNHRESSITEVGTGGNHHHDYDQIQSGPGIAMVPMATATTTTVSPHAVVVQEKHRSGNSGPKKVKARQVTAINQQDEEEMI